MSLPKKGSGSYRVWENGWEKPIIEHTKPTKWGWVVWHPKNLKLGKETDIGYGTCIFAHHGVIIGDYVQIGSHCSIYSLNSIDKTKGKIIIGKNTKIGTHSTILPGIKIGEGVTIGAYSLVNKDIPSFTIVAGIPAKPLIKKKCPRCMMEF